MKRWFVMLLIGMTTAAIAAGVDICIDVLAGSKYSLVASCILKEQINSGGKVPGSTQLVNSCHYSPFLKSSCFAFKIIFWKWEYIILYLIFSWAPYEQTQD